MTVQDGRSFRFGTRLPVLPELEKAAKSTQVLLAEADKAA
jgi:hypothetical protein